jgi:FeS assembly SUF system protein
MELAMEEPARQRLALPLSGEKPQPAEAPPLDANASLEERIVAALRSVYDPEIPINIHELGLIYKLEISPEGAVGIQMTLTSPACPVAGALPEEVRRKVAGVPGVTSAKVELVWDPPWDRSRMSEEAQLQLGLF